MEARQALFEESSNGVPARRLIYRGKIRLK
jgi:hypothetical protein